MEAKSIENPIYEVLEKKEIISEAREYELLEFLDNNEGLNIYQLSKRLGWDQNLIYINRKSGILDMLDIDEIDPRVLVEFDKK